jgi:hypothetical protein
MASRVNFAEIEVDFGTAEVNIAVVTLWHVLVASAGDHTNVTLDSVGFTTGPAEAGITPDTRSIAPAAPAAKVRIIGQHLLPDSRSTASSHKANRGERPTGSTFQVVLRQRSGLSDPDPGKPLPATFGESSKTWLAERTLRPRARGEYTAC